MSTMEKKNTSRELESVSGLFISSSDEAKAGPGEIKSDQTDDELEIEELIKVTKKIAHPNTQNAQEGMKKLLFSHLQEDYLISRIVLTRTTDSLEAKRKKTREEEIVIFMKEK